VQNRVPGHREHPARAALEAARRHAPGAAAHLRGLSRPDLGRAPVSRINAGDEACAEGRRRHLPRHPRRRAPPRPAARAPRRRSELLLQPGPDHTGPARQADFRRISFGKVSGTVRSCGTTGCVRFLYGTLLRAPTSARAAPAKCARCARRGSRSACTAGTTCAGRTSSPSATAPGPSARWRSPGSVSSRIFGERPRSWAAAGWQTNRHAAAWQQRARARLCLRHARVLALSFRFGVARRRAACSSRPRCRRLDELIGREPTRSRACSPPRRPGAQHVFTAHAELEGGQLAGMLEALLAGWTAQGYEIVSLAAFGARSTHARCRATRWCTARCRAARARSPFRDRSVGHDVREDHPERHDCRRRA
jgi:hypothetical protein